MTKKDEMKTNKTNLYLNFVTAIVAIVGLVFAWSANAKAAEANKIANEANQLANKALFFQQLSLSADIKIDQNVPSVLFSTYGCKASPPNNWYGIASNASFVETFNNQGGATVSLVEVMAVDNLYRHWNLEIYGKENNEEPITLPYDIPPGASRKLYFKISTYHYTGDKQVDEFSESGYINRMNWLYSFGDGRFLNHETEMVDKGPHTWIKEAICQ